MEFGTVSAIVAATITVTSAIGGLLLRAFVNPVKVKTEANDKVIKDHEERIRDLESMTSAHTIHLENLMKAVDKLVDKIDALITYETKQQRGE